MPKNMATVYNRLITRSKDGLAVAEARNSSCTACFMALRPQMMSDVRKGEDIITCEHCGRILYFAPAAPTEKPSETAAVQPNAAASS